MFVDEASAVILCGCRSGRGAVLDRGPLGRVRGWSRPVGSLARDILLHVAKTQEGGLCGPHGEVHVLGLKDNGVRGPAPGVADVG